MFAIAFDLLVADTAANHPRGVSQAYADIGSTLAGFGFNRVQGSLYLAELDDLANLFSAIMALKALAWFPASSNVASTVEPSGSTVFTRLPESS